MSHSQGKAIGDSFSVDQNPKMRTTGELGEEAGPSPDLPDHTHAERLLGCQRRMMLISARLCTGFCDWICLD